jgi:hypothetical protein
VHGELLAGDQGGRFHGVGDPAGCRVDQAPEPSSSTWADFLCSQAEALLVCGFFETVTLTGARLYVFAVIEHAKRRIGVLGATARPSGAWVVQAAKNLVMDQGVQALERHGVEGAGSRQQ